MKQQESEHPTSGEAIIIKGARVNNLKNISLTIPRGKLVVVTGLSGSGKSSLAFDTLYAEGQRRYVESLSAYARQFLGRMRKPECDLIAGVPPAIAIEQRVVSRNPRSTVATSTEIYEYLRLLFARVGRTISPTSGEEVKKHTVADLVAYVADRPIGSKLYLLVGLQTPQGRSLREHLQIQQQQGYTRIFVAGEMKRIEDILSAETDFSDTASCFLLIDRLVIAEDKADYESCGFGRDSFFRRKRGVPAAHRKPGRNGGGTDVQQCVRSRWAYLSGAESGDVQLQQSYRGMPYLRRFREGNGDR